MMREYLGLLPSKHQQMMHASLVGIYFVANFFGSGMADFVFDEKENVYTILIINPDVLHTGISDWMTHREATCFKPAGDGEQDISIRVEAGSAYSGYSTCCFTKARICSITRRI